MSRGGATLVEVVVVVFITALLLVVLARAWHGLVQSISGRERELQEMRTLQLSLQRLAQDQARANDPVDVGVAESVEITPSTRVWSLTTAGGWEVSHRFESDGERWTWLRDTSDGVEVLARGIEFEWNESLSRETVRLLVHGDGVAVGAGLAWIEVPASIPAESVERVVWLAPAGAPAERAPMIEIIGGRVYVVAPKVGWSGEAVLVAQRSRLWRGTATTEARSSVSRR